MTLQTNGKEYLPIKTEEQNIEDDSDTTLASNGYVRKRSRKQKSSMPATLTWFRWSSLALLQILIVVLLLRTNGNNSRAEWSIDKTETGGDVNGLYIPKSHKYTVLVSDEESFIPDMSSNANRMDVRKNWDKLMPLGSGSVAIPDYKNYPMLGEPITDDPIRTGPIFEASWTHALHCLYYSVDTYHQLVVNGTFGFGGERNDYHAAHCFEYLRNQILCMADMTLEGSSSVMGSKKEGQAHMCRDRSEAIAWIEARRLDDLQDIIGP